MPSAHLRSSQLLGIEHCGRHHTLSVFSSLAKTRIKVHGTSRLLQVSIMGGASWLPVCELYPWLLTPLRLKTLPSAISAGLWLPSWCPLQWRVYDLFLGTRQLATPTRTSPLLAYTTCLQRSVPFIGIRDINQNCEEQHWRGTSLTHDNPDVCARHVKICSISFVSKQIISTINFTTDKPELPLCSLIIRETSTCIS